MTNFSLFPKSFPWAGGWQLASTAICARRMQTTSASSSSPAGAEEISEGPGERRPKKRLCPGGKDPFVQGFVAPGCREVEMLSRGKRAAEGMLRARCRGRQSLASVRWLSGIWSCNGAGAKSILVLQQRPASVTGTTVSSGDYAWGERKRKRNHFSYLDLWDILLESGSAAVIHAVHEQPCWIHLDCLQTNVGLNMSTHARVWPYINTNQPGDCKVNTNKIPLFQLRSKKRNGEQLNCFLSPLSTNI